MSKAKTTALLKNLSTDKKTKDLCCKAETSQPLPFQVDHGFKEYTCSRLSERRELIKRSIMKVDHDEKGIILRSHHEMIQKRKADSLLSSHWRFAATYNEYTVEAICKTLAHRSMITQGRVFELSSGEEYITQQAPDDIRNYVSTYQPPKKRIRLMENITFNKIDVIPVYSDVPNETVESVVIPDSLLFDYTDVNFFNQLTEHNLARAVFMSHETSNLIKCNCCSTSKESSVRCYENPECPCFIMNAKMQQFQSPRDGSSHVKFTSFDPIMFTVSADHFYQHMGFACSELCGCKGNCDNNTLLIPNKRIFPIEVFRTNIDCGFGIRTTGLIPAGTAVMEFVGEIVGEQIHIPCANWNNSDYAYQITYENDNSIQRLLDDMNFDENYKQLLRNLYDIHYYIDPTHSGNIGRMAAHSCAANLELVRVFQKSLSPAHIHLVMVSVMDIFPGTPLTIDYGQEYANRLKDKCQCGTFICMNGPEAKNLEKASHAKLSMCHKTLFNQQLKVFTIEVLHRV